MGGTDDRGTLQVQVADRGVFQGHQAVTPYQNLYGYQQKCGHDPNLDPTDHHSAPKGDEGNGKIRLASVQSGGLHTAQYFC